MNLKRREALLSMLFGAGLVGLRSLATGVPAAILMNPRKALAATDAGAAPMLQNPQFLIFSTSGGGDPVNCNVPGTYDDPNIGHPTDPSMAATPMAFGSDMINGAKVWTTLGASTLARTCFFHHGTYTVIHPDEGKVLRMMGAVANGEMLPSMLSRELQPALGTVRAQPISLSGSFTEAVYYQGAPQALLTPTTLSSVLASPKNGLGSMDLVKLRDQGLDSLNQLIKDSGNTAQKSFIDQYATSTTQLRTLQDGLLTSLSSIKNDNQDSQIQAALILFQMKVTPCVVVHIDFGGDNHSDSNLAGEIAGHASGIGTISNMMNALSSAKMQDQVTFAMMNVFGRTMQAKDVANGRQHNDGHHVTVMIGSKLKASVIGGVAQPAAGKEYQAMSIDSKSGKGSTSGDIAYNATFGAMGQTLAAAVGLTGDTIPNNVLSGAVMNTALAGT
ncbi:MAG TPA: hypothetical protein VHV51_21305 [Polyangiaceae bacterium]|jgi:hypothetical protein|nr:hypothetical protein [Polyangiaceae bacterium]